MSKKSAGDILKSGAQTYNEKEEDYGQSWKKGGQILWKIANEEPIVLESEEDCIRFGLYTRRFDKIIRSFNGEFIADDMNFESIFDTHKDESVYAAMHATLNQDVEKEDEEYNHEPKNTDLLLNNATKDVTDTLETKEWLKCSACGNKDVEIHKDVDMKDGKYLHCPECSNTLGTIVV